MYRATVHGTLPDSTPTMINVFGSVPGHTNPTNEFERGITSVLILVTGYTHFILCPNEGGGCSYMLSQFGCRPMI